MTSNTIQKELHLTHAQMIRFFQIRQDRSGIRSVRRMADALPDAHRKLLCGAFAESLRVLLDPSRRLIERMIDAEELEQTYHRLDRLVDQDSSYRALEALDREVARVQRGELSLAALEGGGLGTLGIGSPEAAVLAALMLRSVLETGAVYGVNISHPWEQELALMILSAVFARSQDAGSEQRQLMAVLRRLGEGSPPDIDREPRIQLAAQRMADSMSLQKFVQGIPVFGISGMFFNTAAVVRLNTLSRCVYKQRYLSAKLRAAGADTGWGIAGINR